MKKKKLLSLFTAFTVAMGTLGSAGAAVYAKTGINSGDFTVSDGFELDEGEDVVSPLEEAALPKSVDLRERGVVTPVKFQAPFGTCWAFGSLAAAETSILTEMGKTYEQTGLDLSEKHLAWFAYQPVDDPYSSQNGEGYHFDLQKSSGSLMNIGGMVFYAGSLLSQGVGPNLEEDYPYQGKNGMFDYYTDDDGNMLKYYYSSSDDWSIDNSERNKKAYTLENDNMLETGYSQEKTEYSQELNTAIKTQINKGYGVSISYCADISQPDEKTKNQTYLNQTNWCQYTYEFKRANHQVCIVGYDDDYPKENFNEDHQPEKNGAYLVKNSWGSGENEFPNRGKDNWGIEKNGVHTGYFWLSYYDKSIYTIEIFDFDLDKTGQQNEIVDQYDYASNTGCNTASTKKDCEMANVFTAQYNQELTDVSCITGTGNVDVTYEVYLMEDNSYSKLVSTAKGSYTYSGYHREKLEKPVRLSKGQKYSIVVKETNSKNEDEIILGYTFLTNDAAISNNLNMYVTTIVNEGESYLKYDGTWYDWIDVREAFNDDSDYTPDNFCIKGYSVLLDSTDLSDHEVKLSKTSYEYDGTEKQPEVTIDGLTYGKDYSVTYSNNINAGTAIVTVTGKGIFSGSKTVTFAITKKESSEANALSTPSWKKITAGKKSIKLSWKKQNGVTGYQIKYSPKKSMKKAKKVTVKSASTGNKTIKKLASKRWYYVKIRSYKTVNGRRTYSKWSAAKKVKTK